jgi:hypothetical protein
MQYSVDGKAGFQSLYWKCYISLTSWPSGLRRCVKAAVFLAWVRIPPKSYFDQECLYWGRGALLGRGWRGFLQLTVTYLPRGGIPPIFVVSQPLGAQHSLEKYSTLPPFTISLLLVELKVTHPTPPHHGQPSQKNITGTMGYIMDWRAPVTGSI